MTLFIIDYTPLKWRSCVCGKSSMFRIFIVLMNSKYEFRLMFMQELGNQWYIYGRIYESNFLRMGGKGV